MTHEADTTNFSMSLVDDPAEAAFSASVNKVPGRPDQFSPTRGKNDHEIRMSFGRWSVRDKFEWECVSCTFLNQPLFLSCEMCGQPRPAIDSETAAIQRHVQRETEQAEQFQAVQFLAAELTPEEQRVFLLQEEEGRLKKERIKEIMALQQGIFNKIREENEEADGFDDLEGSFAWMDLEDTMPIKDLPPATARTSAGSCGYNKKGGNQKPMPDFSHSTISTAPMSSFSGSSHFNLDWSSGSHHSNHSRLGTSNHSRLGGPNSAIPGQALASLKSDSVHSAHGSFLKGSLHRGGSEHNNAAAQAGGYVDFNALKAAVEGIPSKPFALEGGETNALSALPKGSEHSGISSYSLLGGSNHSVESYELEVPDNVRRRGALADSLASLQEFDDGAERRYAGEDSKKKPVAESRPSVVGALSVSGSPSSGKSTSPEEQTRKGKIPPADSHGAYAVAAPVEPKKAKNKSPPVDSHGAYAVAAVAGAAPLAKKLFNKLPGDDGDGVPGGIPAESPEGDDLRSSLHRGEGARKMATPSMIPSEKMPPAAQEPALAKNLYTNRKHEAKSGKSKKSRSVSPRSKKSEKASGGKGVVNIPILNRMLRKKTPSSVKN